MAALTWVFFSWGVGCEKGGGPGGYIVASLSSERVRVMGSAVIDVKVSELTSVGSWTREVGWGCRHRYSSPDRGLLVIKGATNKHTTKKKKGGVGEEREDAGASGCP